MMSNLVCSLLTPFQVDVIQCDIISMAPGDLSYVFTVNSMHA